MRSVDAYANLRDLGRPVVETREAAARLHTPLSTATRALRAAEHAGLVRQIRKGLWAIDPDISPTVLAPYLTAPYPAYVSFWSALAKHDMIDQIPARTEVASLDRSKEIKTPVGVFNIHRLAPELFTGFEGSPQTGYMATPEKALFDSVYVRAPRGGTVRFPELTLPEAFDRAQLNEWIDRIQRPRLRTIVARGVEHALDQAERHARDDY